jgi:hypothetical protein
MSNALTLSRLTDKSLIGGFVIFCKSSFTNLIGACQYTKIVDLTGFCLVFNG